MEIREATAADDLTALIGQLGYPVSSEVAAARRDRVRQAQSMKLFVATVDREVAGFLHMDHTSGMEFDEVARIRALVVHEEHRNKQIGEQLIAQGEAWARSLGLATVMVYSNVVRTRARTFYERHGYNVVKTTNVFEKKL